MKIMSISEKLKSLEIELPEIAKPVANYLPYKIHNSIVIISGQLPMKNGEIQYKGQVGKDLSIEEAQNAAKLCVINMFAILNYIFEGKWGRLDQCLRLGGFVSCLPDFTEHPKVINGASDLVVDIMGENGRHSRAAVGVPSLPLGACVEVEGMFSIK